MKLYKKKEWQKLNYKNIKYHCKSAEEIKKSLQLKKIILCI